MKRFAIIVAGGSGKRMGAEMPKQFMPINGKPILFYTLSVFQKAIPDINLILVLPKKKLILGTNSVKAIKWFIRFR